MEVSVEDLKGIARACAYLHPLIPICYKNIRDGGCEVHGKENRLCFTKFVVLFTHN